MIHTLTSNTTSNNSKVSSYSLNFNDSSLSLDAFQMLRHTPWVVCTLTRFITFGSPHDLSEAKAPQAPRYLSEPSNMVRVPKWFSETFVRQVYASKRRRVMFWIKVFHQNENKFGMRWIASWIIYNAKVQIWIMRKKTKILTKQKPSISNVNLIAPSDNWIWFVLSMLHAFRIDTSEVCAANKMQAESWINSVLGFWSST